MSSSTSQSQLLPNIAVVFCTAPSVIGIRSFFQPQAVLDAVQFPAPTTPESANLAYALLRLNGARNLSISMIIAAIWYRGDRKLLGQAMVALAFFPVVDGFVSWDLTGGGMWNHWPVVPVALGIGAGLMGLLG